jgi:hypothetical protein
MMLVAGNSNDTEVLMILSTHLVETQRGSADSMEARMMTGPLLPDVFSHILCLSGWR